MCSSWLHLFDFGSHVQKPPVFSLLVDVETSVWQNIRTSMNLQPAVPLIHPVHPDVQMKPLPFYDVLDVLIKPSSLGLFTHAPDFTGWYNCLLTHRNQIGGFYSIMTPICKDSAGRIHPDPRVVVTLTIFTARLLIIFDTQAACFIVNSMITWIFILSLLRYL